jgi:hypothetical protein
MSAAPWVLAFCIAGIIITSAALYVETFVLNHIPNGVGKQLLAGNLIIPLTILLILFAVGAVASALIWLRGRE